MDKNLIEMGISNQAFSNNGWKLLKKFKNYKSNYYALIKCETCGEEKLVNYYNFVDVSKKANRCKKCASVEIANSEIGKTYGTVEVLKLDHIDRKGNKYFIYFLVRCTKCGKTSIRLYNRTQWNATNGCKKM